jgi:predicted porin
MNLGAGMALGSGELLAQVISMKREVAAGTEPKATTFGLAYVYPMSKRTNLYATFGTTRNNTTGTFKLNNGANNYAPPAAGGDPKALGFGIRHLF